MKIALDVDEYRETVDLMQRGATMLAILRETLVDHGFDEAAVQRLVEIFWTTMLTEEEE